MVWGLILWWEGQRTIEWRIRGFLTWGFKKPARTPDVRERGYKSKPLSPIRHILTRQRRNAFKPSPLLFSSSNSISSLAVELWSIPIVQCFTVQQMDHRNKEERAQLQSWRKLLAHFDYSPLHTVLYPPEQSYWEIMQCEPDQRNPVASYAIGCTKNSIGQKYYSWVASSLGKGTSTQMLSKVPPAEHFVSVAFSAGDDAVAAGGS